MTLFVDVETHSASERYAMDPDRFFRLGGMLAHGRYESVTDPGFLRDAVTRSPLVVGHNMIGFDLPTLGVDVLQLATERRVLDTMILDALQDPPDFGMKPEQAMRGKYALDPACARHGVEGKSGDLKALAREFAGHGDCRHGCGFGEIPTDDPRYRSYLESDVRATASLFDRVGRDVGEYAWREMRIAALGAVMGATGFAVDVPLLRERVDEGERRQRELVKWLVETHGIPTTLPDGKPAKSPHATKAGKAALVEAFAEVGVPPERLPRTPKGAFSFGAEPLADVAARFPQAADLCDAVAALVGVRSVYATAARYLHGDRRVHPDVTMFQASGRWSITKPGLTVFGKRGARLVERDIFVPAPGSVLLSADLSQVDARAVAAHSGDRAYMALFAPGRDSHEIVARMVWGDALYESDPKYYRQAAKIIGHGTNYGMGVSRLALAASVPEEDAQRVVSTLREQFPDVERWKHEVRERAEAGDMLDNGFGRLMRPNPERAWTQGPALIGQGTARDILMEGLLRMPLRVQRMIRAVVHDEVVVECPAEDAQEVRQVIVESLSFDWCPSWMSDPVSFTADCSEPATRWSGCY